MAPDGARRQPPGQESGRPGVLSEPEPGKERPWTFPGRSQVAPEPQPLVHLGVGEVHDGPLVSSLLQRMLLERKEEEKEKAEKELEEVDVLMRAAQLTPLQRRRLEELRRAGAFQAWSGAVASGWRRRKRKKRRKRKLPKTSSSRSSRRLHRQWHVPGWFASSFVGRPELPGIMVGVDVKDSIPCCAGFCWL